MTCEVIPCPRSGGLSFFVCSRVGLCSLAGALIFSRSALRRFYMKLSLCLSHGPIRALFFLSSASERLSQELPFVSVVFILKLRTATFFITTHVHSRVSSLCFYHTATSTADVSSRTRSKVGLNFLPPRTYFCFSNVHQTHKKISGSIEDNHSQNQRSSGTQYASFAKTSRSVRSFSGGRGFVE